LEIEESERNQDVALESPEIESEQNQDVALEISTGKEYQFQKNVSGPCKFHIFYLYLVFLLLSLLLPHILHLLLRVNIRVKYSKVSIVYTGYP